MDIFIILLTALLPIAILVYFIYHKDKKSPEPTGQLVKAFLFGILSIPLSFCMSIPLGLIGVYPAEATSIFGSVSAAFFGAAIPEETAKFIMLWLLLRKNPYFDEKMDGIVYAACVSMGFSAFENLLYLFGDVGNYISIGMSRAITSLPAHLCFGIAMGYYYSLAKFEQKDKEKNRAMTFLAPVLMHGIYDSILFATSFIVETFADTNEGLATILELTLTAVFIFFCLKMWKFASNNIKEHIERDKSDIFKRNKF